MKTMMGRLLNLGQGQSLQSQLLVSFDPLGGALPTALAADAAALHTCICCKPACQVTCWLPPGQMVQKYSTHSMLMQIIHSGRACGSFSLVS